MAVGPRMWVAPPVLLRAAEKPEFIHLANRPYPLDKAEPEVKALSMAKIQSWDPSPAHLRTPGVATPALPGSGDDLRTSRMSSPALPEMTSGFWSSSGDDIREVCRSSPEGPELNSGRPELGRSWPQLPLLKSGPEFKPAVWMSSPVSGLHLRVRRTWAEYLGEPFDLGARVDTARSGQGGRI